MHQSRQRSELLILARWNAATSKARKDFLLVCAYLLPSCCHGGSEIPLSPAQPVSEGQLVHAEASQFRFRREDWHEHRGNVSDRRAGFSGTQFTHLHVFTAVASCCVGVWCSADSSKAHLSGLSVPATSEAQSLAQGDSAWAHDWMGMWLLSCRTAHRPSCLEPRWWPTQVPLE